MSSYKEQTGKVGKNNIEVMTNGDLRIYGDEQLAGSTVIIVPRELVVAFATLIGNLYTASS